MSYYDKSQELKITTSSEMPLRVSTLPKGQCAVKLKVSNDYSNNLAIEFMQFTYVEAHPSAWQAVGYAEPTDDRDLIVYSPLGVSIYYGRQFRSSGDVITHDLTKRDITAKINEILAEIAKHKESLL